MTRGNIGIIACEAGKPFAEKILKELPLIYEKENSEINFHLINTKETHFANTEIKTEILESIRGLDIYVVQDCANTDLPYSVDENLMSLKTAIDAAKRSDATNVTVILPAYPYARQDKSISRECITASLIARELENLGVNRVITLDIHNTAIGGFFAKANLENLFPTKTICNYIKNNFSTDNLVVVAPDTGAMRRAQNYAEKLQVPLAVVYKERDYSASSKILNITLIGNVKNKDCLIIDDMIATGGTIINVAKTLKENGAQKIYISCSLAFFNGNAEEKFTEMYNEKIFESVISTDAIHHNDSFKQNSWFKEVSVAKYFAEVIFNLNHNISISKLLK
jgi:ribose-phosphate pyrophosphokinase